MKANPIGWLVSIVGLAVSAFTLFRKEEDEATDAMGEFQNNTKKEIDKLTLLFSIIQNTEKETKTHKDAIEKVNAVCKEYNKTLLDENATLDEQKLKYKELTKAIQETTAEKIKAKYTEKALQEFAEESNSNFSKFSSRLGSAEYNTGRTRTITNHELGETYEAPIMAAAKKIQEMQDAVKEAIQSSVEESVKALADLQGDAYTQEYEKVVNSIMDQTQRATQASDQEMQAFKYHLTTYINDQVASVRKMNESINEATSGLERYFAPKDPTPIVDSTNYVEMSFEDLEQKVKVKWFTQVVILRKNY